MLPLKSLPLKLTAIGLLALTACALLWTHHRRQQIQLTPQQLTLPADGALHRSARIRLAGKGPIDLDRITIAGPQAHILPESEPEAAIEIQSPVNPQDRQFTIRYATSSSLLKVHFVQDSSDRFRDGTPDFLRLHSAQDRAHFRSWFTALADTAAALPPTRLPREIDDCAALLRWSYRNALHAHDAAWQAATPMDAPPPLPSITQYVYPLTPLAANLFRVRPGAYTAQDPSTGAFAQFADAQTLWQRNTFFVSRDLRAARPGDLLFFRQLEQNSPYHSMILTGPAHNWAVYHTGPIGNGSGPTSGEVRRVAIDDLLHHPDTRWHPIPENSNFLGVYRWNILREDPQ